MFTDKKARLAPPHKTTIDALRAIRDAKRAISNAGALIEMRSPDSRTTNAMKNRCVSMEEELTHFEDIIRQQEGRRMVSDSVKESIEHALSV